MVCEQCNECIEDNEKRAIVRRYDNAEFIIHEECMEKFNSDEEFLAQENNLRGII